MLQREVSAVHFGRWAHRQREEPPGMQAWPQWGSAAEHRPLPVTTWWWIEPVRRSVVS